MSVRFVNSSDITVNINDGFSLLNVAPGVVVDTQLLGQTIQVTVSDLSDSTVGTISSMTYSSTGTVVFSGDTGSYDTFFMPDPSFGPDGGVIFAHASKTGFPSIDYYINDGMLPIASLTYSDMMKSDTVELPPGTYSIDLFEAGTGGDGNAPFSKNGVNVQQGIVYVFYYVESGGLDGAIICTQFSAVPPTTVAPTTAPLTTVAPTTAPLTTVAPTTTIVPNVRPIKINNYWTLILKN